MKRKILICLAFILLLFIMLSQNLYATNDVTQKLYQDITINKDGSITIKEMALLSGEYNGRSREIKFKNSYSTTFTGIYSNFTGNTDIYDGTEITNIKIYDISQENFESIDDINKCEKEYQKVESASNGKYGVYTMSRYSTEADFKIYCPSKKEKVFGMEYTIKDAVVVHNDVAELYWNLIGNNYREDIADFQAIVHLPGENNDLRVWTHGPLSGVNKILNNKTVSFIDTNVSAYKAETIRVMFNKDLVPNASKKSNVDGRENILKYEEMMANDSNAARENQKLQQINLASQSVIELEESPRMFNYNYALNKVNELEDSEDKTNFLAKIENLKDIVNSRWKENIQDQFNSLEFYGLTRRRLNSIEVEINNGFDEEAKLEYRQILDRYTKILDIKDAKTRKISRTIIITIYILLLMCVIYEAIKIIKEKNIFNGLYYRDFPGNYNPYVIEYLMKKKITNLSLSATILNLVAKKIIKLEEIPEDKKNARLILINEDNEVLTESEKTVLDILFKLAGRNNECTLEELKLYGKTEYKAQQLQKKIRLFKKESKEEAEKNEFFKTKVSTIIIKIAIIAVYIFSLIMIGNVFKNAINGLNILKYILGISLITFLFYVIVNKDKNRSKKGKEEFSKWLAHKRFLKDFSKFDEKDLPEIALWEKYLVTATILGCADKVQKRMKLYINNNTNANDYVVDYILLNNAINNNIISVVNRSVNSSISTARSTISASSSGSSSSGGGFGGGSSFGGGRRPDGGGGGGRF